jgi:hypothetical protein
MLNGRNRPVRGRLVNRLKTSALVVALIAAVASHAYGFFFFFPAFDSNGNPITTVNNPNLITSGVTEIGIGFMENAMMPNTMPFPNEVPDPTTVNLVAGGVFPATVTSGVVIANQSTLNVAGGMIASIAVNVFDTSSVSLTKGSVQGFVSLQNSSALTMSGGTLGSVDADANSTATISGGAVTNMLTAFKQGAITISGGSLGGPFGGQLNAQDGGAINITGGDANGGSVSASASGLNSMISITSSFTLSNVSAADAGSVSMQSGTVTGNVSTTIDSLGDGLSPPSVTLGAVQVNGSVNVGAGTNMTLGAGTSVVGTVTVGQNANLVTSAAIGPLALASNCSITVNGGSIMSDVSVNNGNISMNDGTVFFDLFTNTGTIGMTGGIVGVNVSAFDSGTIAVGGGMINGNVVAEGASTAMLAGGTVGHDAIAAGQSASITISGATIGVDAAAENSGTVNMESGSIGGNLQAQQQASVHMDGGTVGGDLVVINSGSATITGGLVSGSISVSNSGAATMNSGAVVGGATTANSSSLIINDGSIAGLVGTQDSSKILILGGLMGSGVTAADNSTIVIDGLATIAGQVAAHDNSTISIRNATILGGVLATGSSTVNLLFPGSTIFGPIEATQNGHIVLGLGSMGSGSPSPAADRLNLIAADAPTPTNEIFLYDDSTLEFDGLTFNAALVDPMNDNGMFSEYDLTGTLGDGSSLPDGLTLFVENGSGASFQFVPVPEPGAAGLVLSALAPVLLGRRRRQGSRRSRPA